MTTDEIQVKACILEDEIQLNIMTDEIQVNIFNRSNTVPVNILKGEIQGK